MLDLIVVEDDLKTNLKIVNLLKKIVFDRNECFVKSFNTFTPELRKIVSENMVQKIYILDIELDKNFSGLDIAKLIRKNDWNSEIIFITSHDKMFEQVYRSVLKVYDFIEKFHDLENRLEKDIKVILNNKYDDALFIHHTRTVDFHLYLRDITYIGRDKSERKIVINTTNNSFLINMNLCDIMKKLDKRFRMVHRSCIVNVDRVIQFEWSQGYFMLDNNEKIFLLSKKYKSEVFRD